MSYVQEYEMSRLIAVWIAIKTFILDTTLVGSVAAFVVCATVFVAQTTQAQDRGSSASADRRLELTPTELREAVTMTMEALDRRQGREPAGPAIPWPPILFGLGIVVTIITGFLQSVLNGIRSEMKEMGKKIEESNARQKDDQAVQGQHREGLHEMQLSVRGLEDQTARIDRDVERLDGHVRSLDQKVGDLGSEVHELTLHANASRGRKS